MELVYSLIIYNNKFSLVDIYKNKLYNHNFL